MDKDLARRKLLKYQGRNVPRYTSYPTAPHFGPAVDDATYRDWLAAIAPGASLSLYVHIPFCHELCWYCGCHTQVVRRDAPVAAYLDVLEREIATVAARVPAGTRVGHVHWGGGTPSLLGPVAMLRLAEALRGAFAFSPAPEFAVEIDPRRFDTARATALAEAGVTRASVGVQDLTPEVQRAMHRLQSPEETRSTIEMLRRVGIEAINIDLMYGLPRQTIATVLATLDEVLTLAPSRISLFGYAHVPWMKRHQRLIDEATLPGPEARLAQMSAAADRLAGAGYIAIGLDHFARADDSLARAYEEGRLGRNFQGYTDDAAEVLLGFGASAIGRLAEGYVQNTTPIDAYMAKIRKSGLAVARGVALGGEDRLRREVIERLMCDLRVDLAGVAARHGYDEFPFAEDVAGLAPYVADGLVEIEDGTVIVETAARALVRNVAAVFDRYLEDAPGRHAPSL